MNDLSQLNRHPINQAAGTMLRKASRQPALLPNQPMNALALAISQLPEDDPRQAVLQDYSQSPEMQARALERLAKYLDPAEILAGTPQQSAEQIAEELQPVLSDRE